MFAGRLRMGSVLVLCLLPAFLRADEAEDRAVKTIQRVGGDFRRDEGLPGKPVVSVQFFNSRVTDADLKDVAGLAQLRVLGLNSTKVTDAGFRELASLTQLKELYLTWTKITDASFQQIAHFPQLQLLKLDSTKVTDAGLKHLAALQELKELDLSGTLVTREAVQELQQALPHCHINWETTSIRELRARFTDTPPAEVRSAAPPHSAIVAALGLAVSAGLLWLYRSRTRRALQSRRGRSVLLVLLLAPVGACVWAIMPLSPQVTFTLGDYCELVQFSSDGKTLVTAGRGRTGIGDGEGVDHRGPIRVWDVATGLERHVLATEWPESRTIRVSPESQLIAAHPAHGELKLWNLNTGEEQAPVNPVNPNRVAGVWDCRFSPDGQFLAIEQHRDRKSIIRCWSIKDQQDRGTIEGPMRSMVFAPDGKAVATVAWPDSDKTKRIMLWTLNGPSPQLVKEHRMAVDHGVAVSPTLKTFATVVSPTKPDEAVQMTLWNLGTGDQSYSFTFDMQYRHVSLRFFQDGHVLAAFCYSGEGSVPRQQTKLWDVSATPTEIASLPNLAVLSPDAKWFVNLVDKRPRLVNAATLGEHGMLANPRDKPVFGLNTGTVTFSPDSRYVVISGMRPYWPKGKPQRRSALDPDPREPIVRIWDVEAVREVLALEQCNEIRFSPDGKMAATLHEDNTVKLWKLPVTQSIGKLVGATLLVWLLTGSALWLGIGLVRRWRGTLVEWGAMLRRHGRSALGLAVLVGTLLAVVVAYQATKPNVPREKAAQIAQSMKAEEVVALLGNPHGGLPSSVGHTHPGCHAWSWHYADKTLVVWFFDETDRVKDARVVDPGPSWFASLWENFPLGWW
jgi:WD40 repeat protein